jgi:hypothetical protein
MSDLCTQAGVPLEIDRDMPDLVLSFALRARYPGNNPGNEDVLIILLKQYDILPVSG